MSWTKRGLIFSTKGDFEWSKTHAQVPVILDLGNGVLRIYYSTRDANNKSSISYIEVLASNPLHVSYVHNKPILSFGDMGTFDDSGVMPSCVVRNGYDVFLYYIGWTTRQTVPYHNGVGLAVSGDGGRTFHTKYPGPVISVNYKEPYFSGTSFVLKDADLWRMWYLSCFKWELIDGRPEPFYHLKYAESSDGISWNQNGKVAVDLKENEGGIASASVVKKAESYKMWYGYRGASDYRTNTKNSYRIGFAESLDGIDWIRKDNEAGITLSKDSWDSEMISYPYVIEFENKLLMFYNGNGFGRSGFGYAEWER
jgi:hypothetical protein